MDLISAVFVDSYASLSVAAAYEYDLKGSLNHFIF